MTLDGVVDFTKLVREIKQRKTSCAHSWSTSRGGVERCSACGDHFPCQKYRCHHLDCIERGIDLGRRGFPRDFPMTITRLSPHHTSDIDDCAGCAVAPEHHFQLSVDPAVDPEDWILPKGWKLQ